MIIMYYTLVGIVKRFLIFLIKKLYIFISFLEGHEGLKWELGFACFSNGKMEYLFTGTGI